MPLAGHGAGADGAGGILASSVASGEGPVGESQEESGSYLGMCSDGVGEAGRGLASGSGGSPAVPNGGGGGGPAALSGEEEVCKLHGTMGKLFVGSIGAEEDRRWALHCEPGGGGGNGVRRRLGARAQGSPRLWKDWSKCGAKRGGLGREDSQRGGEGRPARCRRRHSTRLEPEEEEQGRKKKRRRPGRRG